MNLCQKKSRLDGCGREGREVETILPIFWRSSTKSKARADESERLAQIAALEKAVDALESAMRAIKLEWENVYDKVNRTMGRLNARIRKSEATAGPENDAELQEGARPPGAHAVLTEMRRKRNVLPR